VLNKRANIVGIIVLSAFFSCSDESTVSEETKQESHLEMQNIGMDLPLNEFVTWVAAKENDLTKTKEISELNYRLSYMPKECLAYIETKNTEYSKELFEEARTHYDGMTYFNLRIELKGGSGELLKYNLNSGQQYNDRITYMSFKMQKDVFLVQDKDTLYPGLFHFERIYEVAPYATVMMAFDNEKFNPEEEFTIVYDDKLFNKGYIKYNYSTKQLIDLPNISGV